MTLTCLTSWLRDTYPDDVLMPCCPGEKRPLYCHTQSRWSWADYNRHIKTKGVSPETGMLLSQLCCIDVDCNPVADELEKRFPVLRQTAMETTSQGRHYFFSRSERADSHGYYDGARQRNSRIDFKTRCFNGTQGFLVVAPSNGRTWVRAPWESELQNLLTIPDDLLHAVARPQHIPRQIRLNFVATDETLDIVTPPWLWKCAYGQMFLDETCSDDAQNPLTMPLPIFSMQNFFDLSEACSLNGCYTGSSEQAANCVQLADFLGLDKRLLQQLAADVAHVQRLQICSQAWTESRRQELKWRLQLAHHQVNPEETLVEIDRTIGSQLRYEPMSGNVRDESRLFHCLPSALPLSQEDQLLSTDLNHALSLQMPHFVTSLLRQYQGKMILAGGAVLGMVATKNSNIGRGNDYDLFLFGISRDSATKIVKAVLSEPEVELACVTGKAVSFRVVRFGQTYDIQVILLLAESAAHVLHGFDWPPSKVGVLATEAGLRVVATPSWVLAVKTLAFPVDPSTWSQSSPVRLTKYYTRGFDVFVPGMQRDMIKLTCSCKTDQLLGIAAVFSLEQQILARRKSLWSWLRKTGRATESELWYQVRSLKLSALSDYGMAFKALRSLRWSLSVAWRQSMAVLGLKWRQLPVGQAANTSKADLNLDWFVPSALRPVCGTFHPADALMDEAIAF